MIAVIALVVVILVVAFSLGAIVKAGVERIGPSATKVDVKLKGAEVWLIAARVTLTGFVLGNPAGCKTTNAVFVDSVTVQVKPGSVFSSKLVVDTINVKSPVITLEGGLTDNNLKQIEKNLNDFIGSSAGATNTAAASSGPAKPGKKLQVNELVISGAKLQVNMTLTAGRTMTLPLPDIHLTDLGTGPEGITPVEVAQQALHAILASATKEITENASKLGKGVINGAEGAGKKATDALKGVFH